MNEDTFDDRELLDEIDAAIAAQKNGKHHLTFNP